MFVAKNPSNCWQFGYWNHSLSFSKGPNTPTSLHLRFEIAPAIWKSHLRSEGRRCVLKSQMRFENASGAWTSQVRFSYRRCEIDIAAAERSKTLTSAASVCLSVCPFVCLYVTPFWLCSHHRIIMKFYYQWQKWRPCKRSRSELKGQGHRGHNPT